MGRCTGHCCHKFPLPPGVTPERVAGGLKYVHQGEFIADMLIHIGPIPGREPGNVGCYEEQHHWTCRHFDQESGDCKSYETRPDMCRDYPYGKACEYKDCTEGSKPDVPVSRLLLMVEK